MAAIAEKKPTLPEIRHEGFCQPTEGRDAVRIEQYLAYRDDVASGRSVAAVRVTRCIECGEVHLEHLL